MTFDWTDERIALLEKLTLAGQTGEQIAAALGSGVTRNAVIGKRHRLVLKRSAPPGAIPQGIVPPVASARDDRRQFSRLTGRVLADRVTAKMAAAERREDVAAVGAECAPKAAQTECPVAAPAPIIPVSTRVTIAELRDSMCSWPIGDPRSDSFHYCGDPRAGRVLAYAGAKRAVASPYCAEHHRVAHESSRAEPARHTPTRITAAA